MPYDYSLFTEIPLYIYLILNFYALGSCLFGKLEYSP